MPSDERTTITLSSGSVCQARGAYVMHPFHETAMRVVIATDTQWTIRYVLGWRWAEYILARWEDWVLWPISDRIKGIRTRGRTDAK